MESSRKSPTITTQGPNANVNTANPTTVNTANSTQDANSVGTVTYINVYGGFH